MNFIKDYEKLLAFFLASALFMLLNQSMNPITFPWDSGQYWNLSDPAVFFTFPEHYRGYFYPFLLLPAHYIANISGELSRYAFRVYSSLVYAFALTIILPSFYVSVFGGKVTFMRRMIVPVLMVILFPGVIVYPLSDLPSFILMFSCANLLLKASLDASEKWSSKSVLCLVLSGFLAYAAYNTRTIYLFPLLLILIAPFILYKGYLFVTKIIAITALIVGMSLAALPQAVINFKTTNTFTPAVIAQFSDKSLFALQLMWGISIQRLSVGIVSYNTPVVQFFLDSAGTQLFDSEKLSRVDVSLSRYLSLVANNPVCFIGIYTRHIINGMDLRNGEVYTQNSKKSCDILSIINFFIIFLGCWVIYIRRTKLAFSHINTAFIPQGDFASERVRATCLWGFWLILLIFPVVAIIPGSAETRFFLPAQLLIYCTIAFNCSIKELKESLRLNFFSIVIFFVVFFSLYCAVTLSTIASQQYSINPKYMFTE